MKPMRDFKDLLIDQLRRQVADLQQQLAEVQTTHETLTPCIQLERERIRNRDDRFQRNRGTNDGQEEAPRRRFER